MSYAPRNPYAQQLDGVRQTAEFLRVKNLPRRDPAAIDIATLVRESTARFARAGGKMTLRPVQAMALAEIEQCRGALAPIPVGGGKTLITLLAPRVIGARRPLLVLPAGLIHKTQLAQSELMEDWCLPPNGIKMVSYETLGREGHADLLTQYAPDMMILDEAHRVKNPKAAVSRRVARYMAANQGTVFVALSGTLMKESLMDYGHLMAWALRAGAPVPLIRNELMEWAEAMDIGKDGPTREPGALLALGSSQAADPHTRAMQNFQERSRATPGVISYDAPPISARLIVRPVQVDLPEVVQGHFTRLRDDWETPDGWALTEAVQVWRHARELALGFHYVWDPRPPREWLEARSKWASFARKTLSSSRTIDSEKQVVTAVLSGDIDDDGALREWIEIKPSFVVRPKMIWHDDTALDLCAAWAKEHPGIIWTEHTFFARALSKRTGITYYGQDGLSDAGAYIEHHPEGKPLIASQGSNSTGRNLQTRWSRNLITSVPASPLTWEQLIGRTHRPGQQKEEVHVEYLVACEEHLNAVATAIKKAVAIAATTGAPQKMLDFDLTVGRAGVGPQWKGTRDRTS